MKCFYALLAGIVSIFPFTSQGAETAQATMFCYSLRFQRGSEPNGNYYLDLTSGNSGRNGELALDFFDSGYTHSAYLSLVDELLGDTLSGAIALDVPDRVDANGDGFPDFFQVSQGVTNVTTSGAYNLQVYGNGSVTATWNRNAGSKDGTCVLSMKLLPFQPVTFYHAFEVLEYSGPFTYAPTLTNVNGSLNLVQTGNSGSFLNGPIGFMKVPTNRFNELTLLSGTWTNESQQPLSYAKHVFARDVRWPTNYYGYVEFDDDGDPSTFYPYALWMLSIDDTNDSNHNSIPDFSDDPIFGSGPRRPQLELVQNATNLLMKLHGDVGHVHELQVLTDLSANIWQSTVSVTLTNDPQVLLLDPPSGGVSYWRVRAR